MSWDFAWIWADGAYFFEWWERDIERAKFRASASAQLNGSKS